MEKASLQKVWEDMKHGVYNFTKDGKCTKCGNCCTALLPITKQELKELQRYVKKHHIQIVRHEGGIDITCPFRNDELGICMVYEKSHKSAETFAVINRRRKLMIPKKSLSMIIDFIL